MRELSRPFHPLPLIFHLLQRRVLKRLTSRPEGMPYGVESLHGKQLSVTTFVGGLR